MDDNWLTDWKKADRRRVSHSNDAMTNRLIGAATAGERLSVIYHGGSTPGEQRTIQPKEIFHVSGYAGAYVHAYCELRHELRIFRVDQLEIRGITRALAPSTHRSSKQATHSFSSGEHKSPYMSTNRHSVSGETGCLVSIVVLFLHTAILAAVLGILLI